MGPLHRWEVCIWPRLDRPQDRRQESGRRSGSLGQLVPDRSPLPDLPDGERPHRHSYLADQTLIPVGAGVATGTHNPIERATVPNRFRGRCSSGCQGGQHSGSGKLPAAVGASDDLGRATGHPGAAETTAITCSRRTLDRRTPVPGQNSSSLPTAGPRGRRCDRREGAAGWSAAWTASAMSCAVSASMTMLRRSSTRGRPARRAGADPRVGDPSAPPRGSRSRWYGAADGLGVLGDGVPARLAVRSGGGVRAPDGNGLGCAPAWACRPRVLRGPGPPPGPRGGPR